MGLWLLVLFIAEMLSRASGSGVRHVFLYTELGEMPEIVGDTSSIVYRSDGDRR